MGFVVVLDGDGHGSSTIRSCFQCTGIRQVRRNPASEARVVRTWILV